MPTIEYFAGHFDGEGCLRMKRHNNGWRLVASVAACYYPVLDAYKAAFGGMIRPARSGSKKPIGEWSLHNQPQLLAFLEALAPYSLEKKPQLLIGIQWLHERGKYSTYRVPYDFILYGNCCASELSRLKRISFPA